MVKNEQEKKVRDIRKEKTIERVKESEQMHLQDRRKVLDLLLQIDIQIKSIELQSGHIGNMKGQLTTGKIRQRDKFGHLFDKEDLPRTITIFEFDLQRMRLELDKMKEDLFFALKGRDLLTLKKYLDNHYRTVREDYQKTIKILGG